MLQLRVRHIALRAVQVALLAAGIMVVLLIFSRQAHAATALTPSLSSGTGRSLRPVTDTTSAVTSTGTSSALRPRPAREPTSTVASTAPSTGPPPRYRTAPEHGD